MKGKATSFDIAHHAGVSQSTVSRALSDSPLVNQETKDKVIRIAKELNYTVDKNASNLRKQQSQTLALLLFEDPTSDDSMINPFFLSMLGSITRACANAGYDLLVSFQNLTDDWHAEYEDSNKADGIILLGYGDYQDYREKLKQLQAQGTHFVRWGAHDAEYPGLSIGCDNFQGGFAITQHLVEAGCETFAFIGGADNHAPEFMARFQGHTEALDNNGLLHNQALQIDAVSTEESGYNATTSLLKQGIQPDAFVCASDLIAVGCIQAIKDAGLLVPNDIKVSGYDNITISGFSSPPLTTVKQNTILAGEILVDSVLKLINGEALRPYLMPAELVVRQSCGGKL